MMMIGLHNNPMKRQIRIVAGCMVAGSDLMTHEGFSQVLQSVLFPSLIVLTIHRGKKKKG